MNNCIFSAHCTEYICDKSCPLLAETSYLLERNRIDITSNVFNVPPVKIARALDIVSSDSILQFLKCEDTISVSNLITYCAICKYWKGSRLHCDVYNLNLSNHLDTIQKSWSVKNQLEELEYEQIWLTTTKVLIISGVDYVSFKDFQSQTLLNILHTRKAANLPTIVVLPKHELLGDGKFFNRLHEVVKEAMVKW